MQPLFTGFTTVALDLPQLGAVPFDPALAAASDRGEALVDTDRPAVRAVRAIAAELSALLEV